MSIRERHCIACDRLNEREFADRVRGLNVASKATDQECFDNIRDEGGARPASGSAPRCWSRDDC